VDPLPSIVKIINDHHLYFTFFPSPPCYAFPSQSKHLNPITGQLVSFFTCSSWVFHGHFAFFMGSSLQQLYIKPAGANLTTFIFIFILLYLFEEYACMYFSLHLPSTTGKQVFRIGQYLLASAF
jgi:hypothetical protein